MGRERGCSGPPCPPSEGPGTGRDLLSSWRGHGMEGEPSTQAWPGRPHPRPRAPAGCWQKRAGCASEPRIPSGSGRADHRVPGHVGTGQTPAGPRAPRGLGRLLSGLRKSRLPPVHVPVARNGRQVSRDEADVKTSREAKYIPDLDLTFPVWRARAPLARCQPGAGSRQGLRAPGRAAADSPPRPFQEPEPVRQGRPLGLHNCQGLSFIESQS